MSTETTIEKIRKAKTMPELDSLRIDTVRAMMSGGQAVFEQVQTEFIKAKNRLKRIPLRDRQW